MCVRISPAGENGNGWSFTQPVCVRHGLLVDWWGRLPARQRTSFLGGDLTGVDPESLRRALGREPFAWLDTDTGVGRTVVDSTDLDGFRLWLAALQAGLSPTQTVRIERQPD